MLLVILFLILNSIIGYGVVKVASNKEIVDLQILITAIIAMGFASLAPFTLMENKIFLISLIIVILTDLTVALKVRKLSKTWKI
jgi:hypothetical protein